MIKHKYKTYKTTSKEPLRTKPLVAKPLKRERPIKNLDSIGLYASTYRLNDAEQRVFKNILLNNGDARFVNNYGAYLFILHKELNQDITKIFKTVIAGIKTNAVNKPVLNLLITIVKESVILANYPLHIEKDGKLGVEPMTKTSRFELLDINREFVFRTFRKYNIPYSSSRGSTYIKQG